MDHRYDRQCQCSKCSDHECAIKRAMAEEYRQDRERLAKRKAMVSSQTTFALVALKPAA